MSQASEFSHKYGPWALVVGGSEGIGAAFAEELARRGLDVVLVARRRENLLELKRRISAAHPERSIRTISFDLTDEDAAAGIIAAVADLEIGCLVYNVGTEPVYGDYLDHEWEFLAGRLQRNLVVEARFVHHFGRLMRARGRGATVLMGSLAGFAGAPGFALYASTKAFGQILGEGLWHEFSKYGVDVLTPVVGPTSTPTMIKAYGHVADSADPAKVAQDALDNLGNGPAWIDDKVAETVAERTSASPRDRVTGIAQRTAALAARKALPTT